MATKITGLLAAILMFLVEPSVAQSPQCQELWNGTCYGMSVSQVLAVVPGAQQAPLNSKKETIAGGATESVSGPQQNIANQKFMPRFYFLNGRLEQVMLTLEGVNSTSQARLTFDSLVEALRSKYGAELDLRNNSLGRQGNWFHNGTNVSLLLLAIGETDPVLNVVYQRRTMQDAGHL